MSKSRDLAVSAVRYGTTVSVLLQLYELQQGLCASCGRTIVDSFHIDHDHVCCDRLPGCGKCIRGLLCSLCNTGIGMLGDNYDGVLKAAMYLKRYEDKRNDFIGQFREGLRSA